MIQEGAFVDMGMQGLGVVRSVFGSEHKRQASVQCGDGSIVEVECAMLKPLPQVAVGDRVLFNGDEDGVVTRIERKDHGWDVWIATGTREFVTSSHHAISAHPNPLVRYAALIHSAERAVDGPATEQAKCIAALAKALREEQARTQRAKETLRSIAEIVRT